MARELYGVANFLGVQVTLTSVESKEDTAVIDPNAVAHTGGKDGDYCAIPQCSGPEYFNDHHMSVAGGKDTNQFQMALWTNDAQGNQLYYSLNGQYSGGVPVDGSGSWQGVTFLIQAQKDVRFFSY